MSLILALVLSLSSHGPSPKPQPIELFGEVKEASGGAGGSRALLMVEGGEYQLHAACSSGPEQAKPAHPTTFAPLTARSACDPSENELKRLSGAKVRIFGITGDPRIPRGKHVLVERYEIVDVGGGVVPRIGQIAKIELGGDTRLLFVDAAGTADLLPEGWGKKMMQHVGAKVWMVGSKNGKEFKPERFAILKTTEGEVR